MILESLLKVNTASGSTEKANEIIKKELSGVADDIYTDNLGNLIVRIGDEGKPATTVFAPADKPALIVTYIEENGCIRVHPLGSVDFRSACYSPVTNGTLSGILYPDSAEADKFSASHADFGFCDAKEARSCICEGDVLFFENPPVSLQNGLVSGVGLSSLGCAQACCIAAKNVVKDNNKCFYFVFICEDSLQHRSVSPAAFGINPVIAVCLEAYEGKNIAAKVADKSFVATPQMTQKLIESAQKCQIELKKHVFSDENGYASRVQSVFNGVKTASLLLPAKHSGSLCETVNKSDIEALSAITVQFLNNI